MNSNSDNARSLLQRALRFNPISKQLWLEVWLLLFIHRSSLEKKLERKLFSYLAL